MLPISPDLSGKGFWYCTTSSHNDEVELAIGNNVRMIRNKFSGVVAGKAKLQKLIKKMKLSQYVISSGLLPI